MNQGTFHQSKYKLTKLKSLALCDVLMSKNARLRHFNFRLLNKPISRSSM